MFKPESKDREKAYFKKVNQDIAALMQTTLEAKKKTNLNLLAKKFTTEDPSKPFLE